MKQTTFEAQAFLEAVQFFRQEKGHYGSWEMMTGDEIQVTRSSECWIWFSVWEVGGQGHNKQSNEESCKNGKTWNQRPLLWLSRSFWSAATPKTARPDMSWGSPKLQGQGEELPLLFFYEHDPSFRWPSAGRVETNVNGMVECKVCGGEFGRQTWVS